MLLQTLWETFVNWLDSGQTLQILSFEISILRLIALGVALVLLFFVFQIIKRIIYRVAKLNAVPPELYNGLLFFVRLIFGVILVWAVLRVLNIDTDYLLIISGVAGTAIAFASVKTINNFVAGVWITLTTPYIVGDYVKIGDVEGIVVKITSFYTRVRTIRHNNVLIPNLSCLSGLILNYTIDVRSYSTKVTDLKKKVANLQEEKSKKWKKRNETLLAHLNDEIAEKDAILIQFNSYRNKLKESETKSSNSEFVQRDKVIRYIFTMDLPKQWRVEESVAELCKEWNVEYKFHVEAALINITSHFVYEFSLLTLDPMDIIVYRSDLLTKLYQKIYQK